LQRCFKIHNELTGKPVDNPVINVLREGTIVGLANHTVLTSKGGREIPIDDSAAPIRGPSGEMTGTVLVFRDVSAQRAAELAMRRLAAIVDDSDDAIVGKNLNGVVTSWNKGAERIFGYSAAEMVGQSITVLMPPDRENEEQAILERLKRGERVDHFETVRQTRAGQRIHVSLSISPIKNAEGRLVGASKIARDITERKRGEQALQNARDELRRHADDLERRVNQRTASLQQTLKSMETVLYTIAHDLRSPNRAMQGFAQLVVEEYGSQLNETARSYLSRISDAAIKNDGLICDLLEYGRLAHAELPMREIDLGQSVQKVLNDLQPQITSKSAIIEAAREMPCVWANDSVLSQIITNLLTNALKFVSDGAPPHIRIWADDSSTGSPSSVKLFVQDNGIGIPSEIQPSLFQPFQRGLVDRSYEGAGMGLAIVQKGAERLGGKVGLQSTPGKGSTFWIELLPANVVEQPMSNEPNDPAARR
jgi:PAS domain S-box-containing protein